MLNEVLTMAPEVVAKIAIGNLDKKRIKVPGVLNKIWIATTKFLPLVIGGAGFGLVIKFLSAG